MIGHGRQVKRPVHDKTYSHPAERQASYETNWEKGCNAARAAWNMSCEAGVTAEKDLPSVEAIELQVEGWIVAPTETETAAAAAAAAEMFPINYPRQWSIRVSSRAGESYREDDPQRGHFR
eukprot:7004342-Heterocapsa_arctica.AAC.1